jgi:multisubunit Na+/H+ antiporter MnhE subunit
MLEATALFLLTFALGLLLQLPLTGAGVAAVVGASAASVLTTALFSGLASGVFTRAPAFALRQARRAGVAFADAIAIVRAALAGDVELNPALVRLRAAEADAPDAAMLANLVGAAPGAVVIAVDDEGLLVHVNREEDERDADIGTASIRKKAQR